MNEPESPIMAKILIRFNFETEIYVRYRSEEIAPQVHRRGAGRGFSTNFPSAKVLKSGKAVFLQFFSAIFLQFLQATTNMTQKRERNTCVPKFEAIEGAIRQ